jgi:hypothetical protein
VENVPTYASMETAVSISSQYGGGGGGGSATDEGVEALGAPTFESFPHAPGAVRGCAQLLAIARVKAHVAVWATDTESPTVGSSRRLRRDGGQAHIDMQARVRSELVQEFGSRVVSSIETSIQAVLSQNVDDWTCVDLALDAQCALLTANSAKVAAVLKQLNQESVDGSVCFLYFPLSPTLSIKGRRSRGLSPPMSHTCRRMRMRVPRLYPDSMERAMRMLR